VTVGDFEIAHVQTARFRWDGGAYFGVVPKTLWGRKVASDDLNRIEVAFNCYVVRTGEHTILIETGVGDKLDARSRERMALPAAHEDLRAAIAAQGIDPESVDIVVNSHLHFDHCGGNTILTPTGATPAFPRARYIASRPEWEHAHTRHPRDSVSYNDANYDPLVDSGRMTLVDGDYEVAPGIWMRRAPGHNRDMCIVTAESNRRTFCFWSDLVPTASHLQPTWVMAFDLYPMECIDQKSRWLARAADEEWICGFSHDAQIGFARVERDGKAGFRAVAA
jgi:glyoxylase-like metal-dependent hydrolase (beta-lactamase superfamily II)